MNKKIVSGMMPLLLVCMSMLVFSEALADSTVVYVDPESSIAPIGSNFTVSLEISDVTELYAWQANVTWNASLFWCNKLTEGDFLSAWGTKPTYFFGADLINQTPGQAFPGATIMAPEYGGTSGSGTLATLDFTVIGKGETPLHLTDIILLNIRNEDIDFTSRDGYFSNTENYEEAYYELLAEYEALNATYNELKVNYYSLNLIYYDLLELYSQLQSDHNSLQENYVTLTDDFNTLTASHNSLLTDYTNLQENYDLLSSNYNTLEAEFEALTGDFGASRNLNYLFIATTIVFIATTVYLVIRKPKMKPMIRNDEDAELPKNTNIQLQLIVSKRTLP